MSLASLDTQAAAQQLREATLHEFPRVTALRERLRSLTIHELGYRQCLALAPVATDGGENRLSFDPLNIELIRVVDSEGREHVQKFIPLSEDASLIQRMFVEIPVLNAFLERIGVSYRDLSYFLPGNRRRPDPEGPTEEDLRKYVRSLRDIIEWAVLLDLAARSAGVRMLVIRDGLLRCKSMSIPAMKSLAKAFEEAYLRTGTMLVGVAKRSKVLSYLSLALTLERTLAKSYPCFVEVPEPLERECYNFAGTWMAGQGFGQMHLAKLAEGPEAAVFPVDIPSWLLPRRKEILEYLAETAKASFPILGYPSPLIRAHENASLGPLEMSVLADLLVRTVAERVGPVDGDRVTQYVSLGRGLVQGGTRVGA